MCSTVHACTMRSTRSMFAMIGDLNILNLLLSIPNAWCDGAIDGTTGSGEAIIVDLLVEGEILSWVRFH